jgi:hypothetical protein
MPEKETPSSNLISQIASIESEAARIVEEAGRKASDLSASSGGDISALERESEKKTAAEIGKMEKENQAAVNRELEARKSVHLKHLAEVRSQGESGVGRAVELIIKSI